MEQPDNPDKIDELGKLVESDPMDTLALFMLGSEQLRAGLYAEAVESLTRCTTLKPDYPAAIRQLADAYRLLGNVDKARTTYEWALWVAEQTGELQVAKEARAFLKRLRGQPERS